MNILGFDNWTGGSAHFERLVDVFRDRGMDLSLVHLGSWGNDPGRPSEEWSGRLRMRDISYYGDYDALLEAEKPTAVLLFSTDTFAHRAFIRLCKAKGIPTVYLYHGIIKAQKNMGGRLYKINLLAQIRYVLRKIPKALRHVWPCYASALLRTHASAADWWRFAADITRGAMGRTARRSADDARTDRCGVYIDADIVDAVDRYGFAREHVTTVGNPDLARFGLRADMLGRALASPPQGRDVMYIDTGLIFTGWVFSSHQDFIDHMLQTRDALAARGRRLVFKPHPDHIRAGVAQKLEAAGLEICPSDAFVSRLQGCEACLVETSTAALVPALLGLPLLLSKYGKLTSLNFGDVLTSYPRSRPLLRLEDIDAALEAERRELDASAARRWIAENAGPLPAEDMPVRAAGIFETLIR